MQTNFLSFQLESSTMITPQVKHLRFRATLDHIFQFQAGQFITVHFEYAGKPIHRSYSIANAPNNDNCIEFAASYVENGPGTNYLYHLTPGEKINVTGPFGRLTLKEQNPTRYIFVATSTGITPYRAMLNELEQRVQTDPNLHVVILQGVRTRQDILYLEDFLFFANQNPRLSFLVYLSREPSEILNPYEQRGYVQHALPTLQLNPANDVVYLCGNPSMVDEAFNDLRTNGFEVQRIIREKYISR